MNKALSPTMDRAVRVAGPGAIAGMGAALAGVVAAIALTSLGPQIALVAPPVFVLGLCALVASKHLPLAGMLAAGTILLSALIDMPRNLGLGAMSGLGLMTLAVAAAGTFVAIIDPPARTAGPPLGFVFFAAWCAAGLLWGGVSVVGIQATIAVTCFLVSIAVGAAAVKTTRGRAAVELSLTLMAVISCMMYLATLLVKGVGEAWFFSPRSFALAALVSLAWSLALVRYGSRHAIWLVIGLALAILFSLSRTAFAIALIITPLAAVSSRGLVKMLRVGLIVLLVAAVFYVVFTQVAVFRERFTEGDVRQVGVVRINASGRLAVWPFIWESFSDSPWLGHGAGSTVELTTSLFGEDLAHAHNDYLKLLHDFGLVGALLWLLGTTAGVTSSFRAWRESDRGGDSAARFHLASALALIAVAISMATDNTISYFFVMAPTGVLLGASRGLAARGRPERER